MSITWLIEVPKCCWDRAAWQNSSYSSICWWKEAHIKQSILSPNQFAFLLVWKWSGGTTKRWRIWKGKGRKTRIIGLFSVRSYIELHPAPWSLCKRFVTKDTHILTPSQNYFHSTDFTEHNGQAKCISCTYPKNLVHYLFIIVIWM